MDPADWQRAAALYFPLVAALIAGLLNGARPRQFAACLLSVLWVAPALLLVQLLNQREHWWSFAPGSAAEFRGMPLELFLGWMVLWGVLPQVALRRFGIVATSAIMLAADCLFMPLATAAIRLKPQWLIGEAVAITTVLLPALCLGRWTERNSHLRGRAVLQIATSGLLFLFLIPETIFALRPGMGWKPLLNQPGWLLQISLQGIMLLAIPGISAVMEFAERGLGTPIPYDAPQKLVTSGFYRYCANPMQVSCALVMLAWAGLLRNGWMSAAACVSVVYSAGIAEWDEKQDLARRFGQPWRDYSSAVGAWRPRWTPYHAGPAALIYIARTCGPCSEVRAWLESRDPKGLRIVDAETLPPNSIQRIRYDAQDGSSPVDGILAVARALEHIHLGWAFAGAAMRLPVAWRILQLLADASGLGPRGVVSYQTDPNPITSADTCPALPPLE
jgi:protein-S-isoprenylcysteine O-methyltransferase Ste14